MNAIEDRTLEALVDGELSEPERAAVLGELDHSPDGWRRLALTFLADQTLKQTFAPTTQRAVVLSPPRLVMSRVAKPRAAWRSWAPMAAACAASALLAFFLGMWSVPTAVQVVHTAPAEVSPAVAKAESPPALSQEAPAMPTLSLSARRELERRGFVIQERPRMVPVLRQDGRTIQVLINEIELQYVGRQSIL